ncbi:nuclear transport factor 2 family protein [Sphingomonas phyllosphaerae]|uniref:nuclear transport factor 2 family protein n=1 Tax=Sphingomonas phyllosphaerae TaxID=257003 RepID=UPI0004087C08|nr:nuclear transport factor 2 family protein [Sphingomonas phyllosphaerae]
MTEDEIKECFAGQLAAMQRGDTAALALMLAESYTLTHITGYRQPKREWLKQMGEDLFIYHKIEMRTLAVTINANRASSSARLIADVTVYGSRRTWRLQLDQHYEARQDALLVTDCVASTW